MHRGAHGREGLLGDGARALGALGQHLLDEARLGLQLGPPFPERSEVLHDVVGEERLAVDAPERAVAMAEALAPRFGLDPAAARRAGEEAAGALATPLLARARRARRLWRELPLWFPQDGELVEGVVDLVFEEDGRLVVVDYKTDHIAEVQVLAQAAHHAPQLRVYSRGLAQAMALPVAERLVLFTALGRAVPV